MQQTIASVRDELSKKEQALRSITGKVSASHYLTSLIVFQNVLYGNDIS